MPRATRRHPAVLPPKSGLTYHVTPAAVLYNRRRCLQAAIHLPVTQRRAVDPNRLNLRPGIALYVSTSTEIAAYSSVQSIKRRVVTRGSSLFTTRGPPQPMPTDVQRTFGPSLGQIRNKPFSVVVLSLLGPRYPGQSAAKAQATDIGTIAVLSFTLALKTYLLSR